MYFAIKYLAKSNFCIILDKNLAKRILGKKMTDDGKLDILRERIKEEQSRFDQELQKEIAQKGEWHSVANRRDDDTSSSLSFRGNDLRFVGKNLENGRFAGENLQGANFSVANLTNVDFSGADLRGVDFSGANLTDANLAGADLSGAILSGTVLHRTDFSKAKLNGVKLVDADLEDAVLLGIEIDEIGLEELQSLVEYLAKYYPHKLNLRKLNLTLLHLASIDLSRLDLRGVDFTGVDFTGVNITGLDLSECIITPQQIAQALGRVPNKEELARILAPKKKKQQAYSGMDFTELFLGNNKEFGVLDFQHDKGVSIETLLKAGKKVFGKSAKPEVKDEKGLAAAKSKEELQAKSHNEELRRIIEERKQKELEARKAMKENLEQEKQKNKDNREKMILVRDAGRGR